MQEEQSHLNLLSFTKLVICLSAGGFKVKIDTIKLFNVFMSLSEKKPMIHFITSSDEWYAYDVQNDRWENN